MTTNTDVVVIGGGYAGVIAANRLTKHDGVTVTLINPRSEFVERIRLHQLVTGSDDAVMDYRELLAPRVHLLVDTVTLIDHDVQRLELASGGDLGYDYLVYAAGSGSADPRVSGAAEFAYPIATFEEAERLRPVLRATPDGAPVTVVGAGSTGLEIATELAEADRTVTMVCGDSFGTYLHPKARRSAVKRLAELGVTVLEGPTARVTAVTRDAVHLADGGELPSAVTIWTVGFGAPDLAARSGLSTDAQGRLLTDETLTSVDDRHIVAAGDSAAPSNLPYRMSCQAARPLGAHAADTVLARIAGDRPEAIRLGFAGLCLSLGRRAGIFQMADRDDTPKWMYLAGRPGATMKELVCKQTVKELATEARKPGALTWVSDRTRAARLRERRDAVQPAR
ncbi:NAD(P)/FAD-dependent oxidoreductase [Nocardia sp. NPDC057668]|uniref:NAD(P)/FAD-dependent oxidoreductase n=1 Tax=Nocardia sp. NPDC057668 TaxID=3346202 RepID=UPI00366F8639